MLQLTLLASSALAAASQSSSTCQWTSPQGSWDLSPLTLQSSTYVSTDARDSSFNYYYNFCRNALAEVPSTPGSPAPYIPQPNPPENPCPQLDSPRLAWQYQSLPGKDNCYSLGWGSQRGYSFSVFDPKKPARGVVLQYPGGDSTWCPNNKNRTFSIELLCAPTQGNQAQFASANVVEANTCDYRVQLKSLAGCPLVCITGSTMCNGNGICGYNTDTQANQCFCNSGFSGAQCSAHPAAAKQGLGAEGVILIIVCLMLAGVLGLVGYMFMRLRKLSVDPSAYGELQGKCE